eukprot:480750_1
MESTFCDFVPSLESGINGFVYILGAATVVWHSYHFLQDKHTVEVDKVYTIMTTICFIFITITFICYGSACALWCVHYGLAKILNGSGDALYSIQYLILILFNFYRLCLVFEDSAFNVSRCTKIGFYAHYIILVFLAIMTVLSYSFERHSLYSVVLTGCSYGLGVLLVAFSISLFIYKLMAISKVTKAAGVADESLTLIVTKTFILTLVSMVSCIAMGVVLVIWSLVGSNTHMSFVVDLTLALDLITNCLSILYGFQCFEASYMKACGCCHTICLRCFNKMDQIEKNVATEMSNVAGISVADASFSTLSRPARVSMTIPTIVVEPTLPHNSSISAVSAASHQSSTLQVPDS